MYFLRPGGHGSAFPKEPPAWLCCASQRVWQLLCMSLEDLLVMKLPPQAVSIHSQWSLYFALPSGFIPSFIPGFRQSSKVSSFIPDLIPSWNEPSSWLMVSYRFHGGFIPFVQVSGFIPGVLPVSYWFHTGLIGMEPKPGCLHTKIRFYHILMATLKRLGMFVAFGTVAAI